MADIVIVDYGVGNLRNVQKAFERVGEQAVISSRPDALAAAKGLVLPGVGAFRDAIGKLRQSGLFEPVRQFALVDKRPVLGICLGMQLLTKGSEEDGWQDGLGIVRATTKLIPAAEKNLRLPHIGWNSIDILRPSSLFKGVTSGTDVYFVHSYHVVCDDPSIAVATCDYGGPFVCAYEVGNVMAAQFHPEKSQDAGLTMLRNFASVVGKRPGC